MADVGSYCHVLPSLYMSGGSTSPKHYQWQDYAAKVLGSRNNMTKEQVRGLAKLCRKRGLDRMIEKYPDREARIRELFANYQNTISNEKDVRYACGGRNGCYFPAWARYDWVVYHEVAHFIDICETYLLYTDRPGHSPHWVGWYLFLLNNVGHYDLDRLLSTLKSFNLRCYLK